MAELEALDATAQAELVRKGELTASDLVEAAIARAQALNPLLNAIVTPLYDQARLSAQAPLSSAPFSGVPFLVKDLVATCAGVRHTEACRLLEHHVAARDSELVARFRQAGLIVVGMSHASELGLLPTSESKLFGRTKNPWDLARSSGGSSGGSAAAVAAGIVPMAHANDMGGSIRIPASCCGLFGLKPTRARTPLGPDFGDIASGLVHQHVVTRSVRDSAVMLDAISGPALGDPYAAPAQFRPFREELGHEPGRLRIGFSALSPSRAPVDDECVSALGKAVKLCEELGHELVEAEPELDVDAMTSAYLTLYAAYTASSLAHFSRLAKKRLEPELVEPHTWALAELGRSTSSADYLAAVTTLQRVTRQIARFFADYELFLTPTLPEPPPPLGTFDAPADTPLMGLFRAGAYASFTALANITGQPAMSVPLEVSSAGLPIGIQFMGRFGDEATLLRLAAQLERARPWSDRRPELSKASAP